MTANRIKLSLFINNFTVSFNNVSFAYLFILKKKKTLITHILTLDIKIMFLSNTNQLFVSYLCCLLYCIWWCPNRVDCMNKMTDVLLIGSSSVFGSVLLIIFRSLCSVGFIFLLVLFVFAMCLVFPMLMLFVYFVINYYANF
jgi:hypothetical protein